MRAMARDARHPILSRLALCAVLLCACLGLSVLALSFVAPDPTPQVTTRFGVGVSEPAPARSGALAAAVRLQTLFHEGLRDAFRASEGRVGTGLVVLAFLYGVFHAVGPGHGKAVIASYIVADAQTLRRGLALSSAAALLQALVAIAVVGVGGALLGFGARALADIENHLALAGYALVAAIGLLLLWRKSATIVRSGAGHDAHGACGGSCCAHSVSPAAAQRRLRESLGVIVAAGARPCTGALVVLALAFAQGAQATGIAATLAMAAGTALTTGLVATLAVFAKRLALRLAATGRERSAVALGLLELLAGGVLASLGIVLLIGLIA